MRKWTHGVVGAIALAWAGAAMGADVDKSEPGPLDPARVQGSGSGSASESGISGGESAKGSTEGDDVRARFEAGKTNDHDAKDHDAKDESGSGSAEHAGTTTMQQGEGLGPQDIAK
jgi:hypothetical protein